MKPPIPSGILHNPAKVPKLSAERWVPSTELPNWQILGVLKGLAAAYAAATDKKGVV